MLNGYGWHGNGDCEFFGNGFSWWHYGWHYMIILGVIIIIVALVLFAKRKNKNNENQALSTLKELYVKGEITEEEYLKRKNVIERR